MPPSDFWTLTPGLYAVHLRGVAQAQDRRAQEARLSSYLTAMLLRVDRLPDLQEFVTGEKDRAVEIRRWSEAWDKVDAALNRNHS
ncbi:hypothetical protein ACRARG_12560 [Pseudooceanicola sp. C21-150M6]|uniref:hypothetical protein n=1 Tax=Pseudooceanicola sp. C21-150M6 TaxID=3434355 RepID=UPI003D7FD3B9